jgi:hypothetical protein
MTSSSSKDVPFSFKETFLGLKFLRVNIFFCTLLDPSLFQPWRFFLDKQSLFCQIK